MNALTIPDLNNAIIFLVFMLAILMGTILFALVIYVYQLYLKLKRYRRRHRLRMPHLWILLLLATSIATTADAIKRSPEIDNLSGLDVVIEIVDAAAVSPAPPPVELMHYYNAETKELNLNNMPITNESLIPLEPQLRDFINHIGVERLLLERTALRQIPYTLIGFALVSKSLKYVSFLGNNFNLLDTVDILRNSPDQESRDSLRPRTDSLVAATITSVWGTLSPEIERILEEHNSRGTKYHVYNKIIFVDKTIPPITILNSERRPYSSCERVKYIMVRVGLFGLGVLVTFVPSILPWILENTINGSE